MHPAATLQPGMNRNHNKLRPFDSPDPRPDFKSGNYPRTIRAMALPGGVARIVRM